MRNLFGAQCGPRQWLDVVAAADLSTFPIGPPSPKLCDAAMSAVGQKSPSAVHASDQLPSQFPGNGRKAARRKLGADAAARACRSSMRGWEVEDVRRLWQEAHFALAQLAEAADTLRANLRDEVLCRHRRQQCKRSGSSNLLPRPKLTPPSRPSYRRGRSADRDPCRRAQNLCASPWCGGASISGTIPCRVGAPRRRSSDARE